MTDKSKKTENVEQPQRMVISGNHAAAYACKGVGVDVVAAYPITPQSPIVEKLSAFVDGGELPNTKFVTVESEQSAITAVISAAATGVRVFTASSANGLAFMFESLCWAAGTRLPLVMCVVTRALGAPWSVWTDHQDAFSSRDTGFMQFYCEDNQEIYDTIIMAYRIAEDPRVYLPVFVNYDGYIVSHTLMPVLIEPDEKVRHFIPPLKPHINLMDIDHPKGINPVTTPNPIPHPGEKTAPGYMEIRYAMQKAAENAFDVIMEVNREFSKTFGRSYGNGIYKGYFDEDAEILIFGVGSIASEARASVDMLRFEGVKVGLISLKVYRPFPVKCLREVFKKCKIAVVFDRDVGYGYEGILCYELKAALYGTPNMPYIKGFIVGLGGRDVTQEQLIDGIKMTIAKSKTGQIDYKTEFLGLRLEELGFKPSQNENGGK